MDRNLRPNPRLRSPIVALLGLALLVGACSGSTATANPVPAASAGTTPPSVQVTTSTASSSAGRQGSTAPASDAPSQAPAPSLGELALKWQKGGLVTANKPSTWWPAIDPKTGDIWVSAAYENKFWILSSAGQYLGSWGTQGSGPGQIKLVDNAPHPDPLGTIAFRPDGGFYVGDVGNYRIEQFDPERHFIRAWGTFGTDAGQFSQVVGVITDGTTVYVVDGDRNDIQAFDANGTYLRTFGGTDTVPGFGALDRFGNLYVSYGEDGTPVGIIKYSSSGTEIRRFPLPIPGNAQGLALDPNGDIYTSIADATPPGQSLGTVELAPDGRVLRAWSIGGESVSLSPGGDVIYFAREGNDGTGWPDVRAYTIPKG
jgi:hypothetical protein